MKRHPPAALRGFLEPYGPEVTRVFLAARQTVLKAAPDATELIYDAYNAVTAAYSFTDRLKEAFCHVAAYRNYVNLGFNRGAGLADPQRLLAGSGARIRHIRIAVVEDLDRPGVRQLVKLAVAEARGWGLSSAAPQSIVKAVYPNKRRP